MSISVSTRYLRLETPIYMLSRFFLCFCLLAILRPGLAQVDSTTIPTPDELSTNLDVDPPGRFNLVFTRGLMLAGGSPDSIPINGNASGTYSIGGGIKFALDKQNVLGLRLTPGVSWTHIQYNQTEGKTYPTVGDSLNFSVEKHTMAFADLALSIFINLSRDEDNDRRFFLEAGGYGSFLVSANYKTRFTNADGQRVKNKIRDLEQISDEWLRYRYGLFGRLGYKWAALYVGYRLSDVFDPFTNDILLPRPTDVGFRNPQIPPLEVGISLFF